MIHRNVIGRPPRNAARPVLGERVGDRRRAAPRTADSGRGETPAEGAAAQGGCRRGARPVEVAGVGPVRAV